MRYYPTRKSKTGNTSVNLITMAKVNSFDTSSIMLEISKAAPLALLVFAFLSFLAVGIFAIDYYESLFTSRFGRLAKPMAILIAVIQEAVRFGLLVTSIRDFADKKRLNGWIGLIGSIGLVIHDISLSNSIANMWSPDNPLPYSSLFMFLILIGLLLEFRLILTVGNNQDKTGPGFSKNGATKKGERFAPSQLS